MSRFDRSNSVEVGDGPRDAKNPVVAARRDAHSLRGRGKTLSRTCRTLAVAIEPAAGDATVPDVSGHFRIANALRRPGRLDSAPDDSGFLARAGVAELSNRNRRHSNMKIDPVGERP